MKLRRELIVIWLLNFLIALPQALIAEPVQEAAKTKTISGHIVDGETGEDLAGATVYVEQIKSGSISNIYGYYSVSLPPGEYNIQFTYIGYEKREVSLSLTRDTTMHIELLPAKETLKEVEITGEKTNANVRRAEMSVSRIDAKTIDKIPALMGEVDIIKAIQLLPGVQTAAEGSSGFSVRGGSIDQNLILLDEATVYNPSHLMGFFSVFNNDAVKDVKLYKGDIPAAHGGRLSSMVDVRMKEGNMKNFEGQGGIGTISSRLTLEGPVEKDKASFLLSGRRTYADIFLNFANDEELRDNKVYFYDLNGKFNYKINENNRVYASVYYGKDIFKNDDFKMGWGNETETLRWNHLFNKKMFSNFTFIRSRFDYYLGVPEGETNSFRWESILNDYSFKADFNLFLDANNTIRYGLSGTYHNFVPGSATGLGDNSFFTNYVVPQNHAIESGIYVSNEQKIGARLTLKYGLRFSMFNNIGKGVIYNYDEEYVKIDSTVYPSWEIFNTYTGLEPRLGMVFLLTESSSVKANYTRSYQYVHLASNSTAGTPLDIWFPSSPNVEPQIGDQVAAGYFKNFRNNTIETSIEAYYKFNQNAIDFKDHAELLLNKEIEGELRFGNAWSYGVEFLVRMNNERLNGWVGYTLSKAWRKIPEINNGEAYPSPYDRPHDFSVVLNYELTRRISLGATWVYMTGQPVTFPTGRFEYGNVITPVFSERNSYRLPDYHRLDVSFTLKGKQKENKKWHGEWNFSAYNVYSRKNPWVINFVQDEDNPSKTYAEMTYLFGIVPSITYNFHF